MCIRDRYTTVLPNYFEGIKSYPPEEALDSALALVNNVSKKRLLSHIEEMILRLDQMEFAEPDSLKDNPFAKQLMEETRLSASKIEAFKGIYTSYSLSSSSDCLKMEPFLLSPSDNQVRVEMCIRDRRLPVRQQIKLRPSRSEHSDLLPVGTKYVAYLKL